VETSPTDERALEKHQVPRLQLSGTNEWQSLEIVQALRRVVAANRDPPRRADLLPFLIASYRSRSAKAILLVAFGLVLPATIAAWVAQGQDAIRLLLLVFFGGFLVLLWLVPSFPARRARRAAQRGVLAAGEIVEVHYRGPGDRTTVDATANGLARGSRRVCHPKGEFTEKFASDALWARSLEPGTGMWLLVDPIRPKVLFDLGPMTRSNAIGEDSGAPKSASQ